MIQSADQRRTSHAAMKRHFDTCRCCKAAYRQCAVTRFCPTGRTLWAAFREAWAPPPEPPPSPPLRAMALGILLFLVACTGTPMGPIEPPPPPPEPVIRFVGTCPGAALWWLRVDGVNLPPTGIWLFSQTDSLDFPPQPDAERLDWAELDGAGWIIEGGWALLDSLGTVRVEAACVTPQA
jgi:hypothetical protein